MTACGAGLRGLTQGVAANQRTLAAVGLAIEASLSLLALTVAADAGTLPAVSSAVLAGFSAFAGSVSTLRADAAIVRAGGTVLREFAGSVITDGGTLAAILRASDTILVRAAEAVPARWRTRPVARLANAVGADVAIGAGVRVVAGCGIVRMFAVATKRVTQVVGTGILVKASRLGTLTRLVLAGIIQGTFVSIVTASRLGPMHTPVGRVTGILRAQVLVIARDKPAPLARPPLTTGFGGAHGAVVTGCSIGLHGQLTSSVQTDPLPADWGGPE